MKFMLHEAVAQDGKHILKIMKNKNCRERQILYITHMLNLKG